jgi:hypothetical protein
MARFWKRKSKADLNIPVRWTGDLDDDCIAIWNGLILRAEWMEGNIWWWAVSVHDSDPLSEIDSSNNYTTSCFTGEMARAKAEAAARKYLASL